MVNEGLKVGHLLSLNSEDIRNNANLIQKSAVEIITMSDKGTNSISNLLAMQKKSQNASRNADEVVHELIKKINDISGFSNTISTIAEETKLLAINTSIEAARTGKEGKGFDVIAENIDNLAEQSSFQAKEIQATISRIIKVSKEAIDKLEASNKTSNEQNEIVFETSEIFKSFKDNVTDSIYQINSMYEETSKLIEVRDIVIKSMQEISKVTENQSAITQEVMAIVEEQVNGIVKINSHTQKLKEESERMQKLIESLEV